LNALYTNTTGSNNTAIGKDALFSNTTASNNTAVGYQAGYSVTTSASSVYIGYQAGYSQTNNATGTNCFVGYQAGYNTTGGANTFVGPNGTGAAITTGSKNTVLGGYSGNQGGLDIRTASNYIVLSDGDGNPRAYCDNSGQWVFRNSKNNQIFTVQNTVTTGSVYGQEILYNGQDPNNSTNWFLYCGVTGQQRATINSNGGLTNYQANNTNLSDVREKKNIELAQNYLNKICQIPVKTFLFNDQTDTDLNLGVIAQDVQSVCPELVTESNWAGKDEPEKMRLSIYQTDLQYALMKSIQELKQIVDTQAAEIAELKAK
jgi:hypothetical protein